MKLQTNTSLALFSVLQFARDPARHFPATEIAEKYGVSAHHLAKVLAELTRAGMLESARGVGGGYRFVANPRRVTLMDIIQLFEDFSPKLAARSDGKPATPVETALTAVLSEIDELARATFSSITLTTMLRLVDKNGNAKG
jgi:Rrf2 family protein